MCKDAFLPCNSIPNSSKMFHYYMNVGMSAGISLGVSCLGATCSLYTRKKEIRLDQIIEREQDAMFKHCLLQVSGKNLKKKRGR